MISTPALLAWCRPGFEGECAAELSERAGPLAPGGHARAARGDGFVEFVLPDADAVAVLYASLRWGDLVFARQLLRATAYVANLPARDRLSMLLPPVRALDTPFRDAWVEAPDTDAGKALAPLCRALNAALIAALKRERLLDRDSPLRLHLCFTRPDAAFIAHADVIRAAPWLGGIPRLKFPRQAPSRSTLKLEEAFLVLLDEGERERWLAPGLSAVDLGASPGGWTWQLTRRSIRVTAIDNGPLDPALLESGLVKHLREDGFRYKPPKPVDWLVCDMVEQPRRIAELVARWLAFGWCRRAMFNLKLPMKKRREEVQICLALLADALAATDKRADLRAKQLYHDREEVTVFARVGRNI